MDMTILSKLTNEELLIEKKKLKKRKITNALIIGLLAGIVGFDITTWILGSKPKNFTAFLLPIFFLIYFITLIIKKSKKDKDLKIVLKERNLN